MCLCAQRFLAEHGEVQMSALGLGARPRAWLSFNLFPCKRSPVACAEHLLMSRAAISTLVTAVEILKSGNWAVETSALSPTLAALQLPCWQDRWTPAIHSFA